ncbi:MAG: hypothetical protein SGI72_11005 [Planctomycetota bacterium]|nr:hypothetical protein [Planctomycetota bacterium]
MKNTLRTTSSHAQAAIRFTACALLLCAPAHAQAVDANLEVGRRAPSPAQAHDTGPRAGRETEARTTAVPPLTQVLYSMQDDGTTWASGASYKASFGADGATYIPFFGSDAPRNFPVSLTLGRATAGGAAIDLLPISGVVRSSDTVTIERGPIDEVYELALDRVEQRFVVKERPQAGALDLFVPLTSDLELVSDEGRIELRGEHGTVNYGQAFALLDDGSRVPLESSIVDGAVRIHVDADFMASARFPLVIDPIISTFAITAFGFAPAISYDVSTDRYLIAWEHTFSFADHDVLWHLRSAGGTPIANGVADNSANNCGHPRAANLEGQDQFLLVFQRQGAPGTQWNIWGRTINAASAAQSGSFLISTTDVPGDKINPDVGGDPYFGEAYYCVVWQRELAGELDIHGRLVQYNTILVGTNTLSIDNTTGTLDSKPAISKSSGQLANAAWTVAWQRAGATNSIYAARLSYIGAMLNPPTLIATSSFSVTAPDVSSPRADGRVCLVYGQDDYFNYKLLNGVTVEASGDISNLWLGDPLLIYQYDFTVDTDGTHFVAGFSHTASSSVLFPFVITLASLSPTALTVTEGPILLGGQVGARPDITSKWSSGGPNHDFGIAWDGGGIDGATFYRPSGGPYTTACTGFGTGNNCPCANTGSAGRGCANSAQASGALLAATGNAATGAEESMTFILSNTPAGSPAILFQGTNTPFSPSGFGDGTLCTIGTIVRFALKFPNTFGTMLWPQLPESPLSVQGGVPLAGGTRWYQAYYRDSASFCTSSTFNSSNGVKVIWLP